MAIELLLDQDQDPITVDEGESAFLIGTFEDELGAAIATLDSLTLTLIEETTKKVVNGVNNANILSSFSAGALRHHLSPANNAIVLATLAEGATENHLAVLKWTWNSGNSTGKKTYRFPVEKCHVPVP